MQASGAAVQRLQAIILSRTPRFTPRQRVGFQGRENPKTAQLHKGHHLILIYLRS